MMFRRTPDSRSSAAAWSLAGAWVGILFLAIPFARNIQEAAERLAGPHVYLALTATLGAIFVPAVLIHVFRGDRQQMARRLGGLALLGALAAWVMRTQLQTPAEAIHFFEYGILGLLLFRAWRHQVQDSLIYPISALSLVGIAWLDEWVQWMVPGRFWDFRDIRLNTLAGVLFLLFIAWVVVPSGIRCPVERSSVRRLCRLAWLAILLMGIAISTTPGRVDRIAGRIPFLRFLYNNESVVNEFGHRHADPEIGEFFSRMSLPELLRADRDRGAEAGGILARHPALANRLEFRNVFPATADPFLHELWSHWIRRNHYGAAGWKYRENDPARFTDHLTVAMRENQILEKYFPHALEASGGRWDAGERSRITAHADLDRPYASAVGDHLATAVSEGEAWLLLLGLAGLVGWGHLRWGRE